MKKLLVTTALGLFAAAPALADTHMAAEQTGAPGAAQVDMTADIFVPMVDQAVLASDFIGKRVYVSEADIDPTPINDAAAEWNDIGEIGDVVISRAGDVEAVLVDVGGFLGIGEKTVAVNMSGLTMVQDGDNPDDYFIVVRGTKQAVETAPTYQLEGAETAATPQAEADPAPVATAQNFDGLTAEQLTGAPVHGANDEKIGEVSDLVLGQDDSITHVIVDVGGFLGLGSKSVALSPDMVTVAQPDADDPRLIVAASEDQLKQMPEFTR